MHRLRLALATAGLLAAGGFAGAHAAPPAYSGVQTVQYYGGYGCDWRCREWHHHR